jgi:hypothetical protein
LKEKEQQGDERYADNPLLGHFWIWFVIFHEVFSEDKKQTQEQNQDQCSRALKSAKIDGVVD